MFRSIVGLTLGLLLAVARTSHADPLEVRSKSDISPLQSRDDVTAREHQEANEGSPPEEQLEFEDELGEAVQADETSRRHRRGIYQNARDWLSQKAGSAKRVFSRRRNSGRNTGGVAQCGNSDDPPPYASVIRSEQQPQQRRGGVRGFFSRVFKRGKKSEHLPPSYESLTRSQQQQQQQRGGARRLLSRLFRRGKNTGDLPPPSYQSVFHSEDQEQQPIGGPYQQPDEVKLPIHPVSG